ncbi:branched-chain amino acid ABC transporter permease [Allorhizobium pseudoryzae]|jgi:branched-chain amino acid transport system permease protein|uniref:branched-chain amino acid ABC transporter permease n=1 Tax=Rhizobium/Agrobacterium group TaxID=227290 RepID=UPI0013ED36FF|nr:MULTISPECIES: branched-chain amino acid ABC transporter permease [Rhizobium/Agrobacterium group]MCY1666819.1 branched-chain amino acid ABC transporter permease [Rhizobium sp. SL86]
MGLGPYLLLATLEGLVQAAVLCITAAGLSLVFGVMRVVNVAHGEFVMLGAVIAWYAASLLTGHPALGFVVALIISPLIVGAIAALSERLILKRLDYNPEATIVATIGLLYIIQQSVLILYGPDARPVDPPFYYTIRLPWFGYSAYKLFVIGAAILIMGLIWFVLQKTRAGLIMRATQFDRETAQAFGIPVDKVSAYVFALGAGLAAIAGILVVPIQQAHYLMGTDPLLLSFIVVIIGGLGSMSGTVVAAILIGLSDGILSMMFSPTLAKMVSTLLVALVLVFRPNGLFGKAAR